MKRINWWQGQRVTYQELKKDVRANERLISDIVSVLDRQYNVATCASFWSGYGLPTYSIAPNINMSASCAIVLQNVPDQYLYTSAYIKILSAFDVYFKNGIVKRIPSGTWNFVMTGSNDIISIPDISASFDAKVTINAAICFNHDKIVKPLSSVSGMLDISANDGSGNYYLAAVDDGTVNIEDNTALRPFLFDDLLTGNVTDDLASAALSSVMSVVWAGQAYGGANATSSLFFKGQTNYPITGTEIYNPIHSSKYEIQDYSDFASAAQQYYWYSYCAPVAEMKNAVSATFGNAVWYNSGQVNSIFTNGTLYNIASGVLSSSILYLASQIGIDNKEGPDRFGRVDLDAMTTVQDMKYFMDAYPNTSMLDFLPSGTLLFTLLTGSIDGWTGISAEQNASYPIASSFPVISGDNNYLNGEALRSGLKLIREITDFGALTSANLQDSHFYYPSYFIKADGNTSALSKSKLGSYKTLQVQNYHEAPDVCFIMRAGQFRNYDTGILSDEWSFNEVTDALGLSANADRIDYTSSSPLVLNGLQNTTSPIISNHDNFFQWDSVSQSWNYRYDNGDNKFYRDGVLKVWSSEDSIAVSRYKYESTESFPSTYQRYIYDMRYLTFSIPTVSAASGHFYHSLGVGAAYNLISAVSITRKNYYYASLGHLMINNSMHEQGNYDKDTCGRVYLKPSVFLDFNSGYNRTDSNDIMSINDLNIYKLNNSDGFIEKYSIPVDRIFSYNNYDSQYEISSQRNYDGLNNYHKPYESRYVAVIPNEAYWVNEVNRTTDINVENISYDFSAVFGQSGASGVSANFSELGQTIDPQFTKTLNFLSIPVYYEPTVTCSNFADNCFTVNIYNCNNGTGLPTGSPVASALCNVNSLCGAPSYLDSAYSNIVMAIDPPYETTASQVFAVTIERSSLYSNYGKNVIFDWLGYTDFQGGSFSGNLYRFASAASWSREQTRSLIVDFYTLCGQQIANVFNSNNTTGQFFPTVDLTDQYSLKSYFSTMSLDRTLQTTTGTTQDISYWGPKKAVTSAYPKTFSTSLGYTTTGVPYTVNLKSDYINSATSALTAVRYENYNLEITYYDEEWLSANDNAQPSARTKFVNKIGIWDIDRLKYYPIELPFNYGFTSAATGWISVLQAFKTLNNNIVFLATVPPFSGTAGNMPKVEVYKISTEELINSISRKKIYGWSNT